MKKEYIYLFLYFSILTIELISTTFAFPQIIHFIAKPLLIITLIIYFTKHKLQKSSIKKIVIIALLFSLTGDILLMFVNIKSSLFIFGLIAFLIAHIMYALAFSRQQNKDLKLLPILCFLLTYGVIFFIFINNSLGNLRVPVALYMIVILVMVFFAYLRKGKVNNRSFLFVFFGALLFVISDSLLAINKFHMPITLSNVWIMTTYAIAQLLIVTGITKVI